ncbi:hypothetical protein [Bosea sp. Root381]|uniref:hypothetical protein n=1 Tax=Bosea sp. Root381 TaxID=1736524 RepID=UPI000B006279|nr:hypothetical protein [Bosea sp. Root381]
MTMPTNTLRRTTLIALLVSVLGSYPGAIWLLGPIKAIEIGNVMVLALAAGIVVAYAPVARDALRYGLIDGANILSIGIFASWLGVVVARGGSILWRLSGQPLEWLNSGWWGFHIALSCIGALCHLVAPEAVAGRVPTRHWIKIGLLVALGVLFAGVVAVFIDPPA